MKDNRAVSPRRPDYNRLYASYCKERYGGRNGKEMFQSLTEIVATYEENNPCSVITYQEYQEQENAITPFILTILSPLMRRVHEMVSVVNLHCSTQGRSVYCNMGGGGEVHENCWVYLCFSLRPQAWEFWTC